MNAIRLLPILGLILAAEGCGSSGALVTPAMVDAAKKRSPEASQESLERGRAAFVKKCKECHALPDPKKQTAEEWPRLVQKMGKLAKLDEAAQRDVLDYILAARDADQ